MQVSSRIAAFPVKSAKQFTEHNSQRTYSEPVRWTARERFSVYFSHVTSAAPTEAHIIPSHQTLCFRLEEHVNFGAPLAFFPLQVLSSSCEGSHSHLTPQEDLAHVYNSQVQAGPQSTIALFSPFSHQTQKWMKPHFRHCAVREGNFTAEISNTSLYNII